jgi:DNA-binding MarR family transcriptional regulator
MDYYDPHMDFLPTLKELVRAYQAFEAYSIPHVRSMGLSSVQFDVIATLANQAPMTFKELSEKTLISKTSLTGVVERMAQKGYVIIQANTEDGRSQKIKLTTKGQKTFTKAFPAHIAHLQKAFGKLTKQELNNTQAVLQSLKNIFQGE